jgi:8-oxo-dGTP pyrophosphatase MutT (NUDIX family)
MTDRFERVDSEVAWKGKIAEVRIERFRHADGEVVEREVIGHPGAVAVVAHDDEQVWLVRQPRAAAGEPALLELPAGKLDVEGEGPLETAKRELAEEIGKAASHWRELTSFYTSPGFTDERVVVYLATGLSDADAEADETERIEVVPWPLARVAEAIERCHDSKSLVGLLWFAAERAGLLAR